MSTLYVVSEFSRYLGGRFKDDGEFSGQEFRDEKLIPAVERALRRNEKLVIDFDGVAGMPTSFLEEAFGGLVRAKRNVSIGILLDLIVVEAPKTPALWPFTRLAAQYMREEARRH